MAARHDRSAESDRHTGRAAPIDPAEETTGACFLRHFHSCWRALVLRGLHDLTFRSALEGLRVAVRAMAQEGVCPRLMRYGSGLLAGEETLSPYSSGNLLAQMVAEEFGAMGLGGIQFSGPWDDAEVARFLQILENWRREEAGDEQERREEMEAMGILGIEILPIDVETDRDESENGWDSIADLGELRRRARQTFFGAIRVARFQMSSLSGQSMPALRRTRQVVHKIIDTLVEEEFSLLALTALKAFDAQTFLHSVNVCILATALGQRLGLNKRELSELGVAAFFHDLGKMNVPKPVLNKPGTFSPTEWEIMKTHPLEGVRTLFRSDQITELMMKVALVGLEHHMRYDLTGYPRMGDQWDIGVMSRIVSIADCYDAMTSRRTYEKDRLIPHRVMLHMLGRSGKNFDPVLMRLFVGLMGLYPVGSLVELSAGDLALVVATDPADPVRPLVRLVRTGSGETIPGSDLRLRRLADRAVHRGDELPIRCALDPEPLGIDLAAYLL
jgi:HD-GYP domain-containing protein (c-di-GMP phosphodiesterase class II)